MIARDLSINHSPPTSTMSTYHLIYNLDRLPNVRSLKSHFRHPAHHVRHTDVSTGEIIEIQSLDSNSVLWHRVRRFENSILHTSRSRLVRPIRGHI